MLCLPPTACRLLISFCAENKYSASTLQFISFFFAVVALHNSVVIHFIQLLRLAEFVIVGFFPFFHFFLNSKIVPSLAFISQCLHYSKHFASFLSFLFIYLLYFFFSCTNSVQFSFIHFGKHNYVL